jgi:hypothetical protein
LKLLDKIHGKETSSKEIDLVELRHNFMKVYGWIPLSEFKNIKIPELIQLSEYVNKEINRECNMYLSKLRFMGVKHPKW